ncbi:hypothetical protein GCM10009116_06850 [Brevundimonas basaltis]|uniref:Putative membrane protein n=1 Tax=Brevundimonas basaltis TaxID=472166 RepID=A0A7W8I0I6_9CAUL|nr:hypothetical protein [Brevundimonas basaltis]MBB5292390.1 putative membrane protein [Brevundimonas basaltis]
MAEPGDPNAPDDHDDLIGFASPASLQGRARSSETPVGAGSEAVAGSEISSPGSETEPDLFTAPAAATTPVEPEPDPAEPPSPVETPPAEPAPVAAASIFEPSPEFSARQRRREPPAIPGGGMGLYAVYSLILFAVPTLGVSAIIGLLAVTGRPGPEEPLAQSHFIYQQRTLWAAAVAVMIGLIFFLVPFGLGPAIMFIAALWLVARGAAGVWTLKAVRPIADPRSWWI